MSDSATLLIVCTGNVCRSPLAEQLLALALGDSVTVTSAGTRAPVGAPMSEWSAVIARERGVTTADQHVATLLTKDAVRAADLILVAARGHRRAVVELVPRASRKTFTIREFARVIGNVPEAELPNTTQSGVANALRTLAARAAVYRGYSHLEDDAADDIVDPIGGGEQLYRQMESELIPALDAIVSAVRSA